MQNQNNIELANTGNSVETYSNPLGDIVEVNKQTADNLDPRTKALGEIATSAPMDNAPMDGIPPSPEAIQTPEQMTTDN